MKTNKFIYSKITFFLGLILLTTTSCERDITDENNFATFPTTANVFIDAPVGLTDEFFISFDPAGGANTEGFGTDEIIFYEGTSSIRVDVPSPSDPNGGFIGGIFRDRGEGRDLSGFDALTFWIKGTTSAKVGLLGFGTDFITDTHPVTIQNYELSTGWKKVIIPIPDPSKLTQEKGMFIFSAGTESTGGQAFTFWIDEIKFEKLGTLKLKNFYIQNGNDEEINAFTGVRQTITGLGAVYNLPNGINQNITIAPSYFDFESSDSSVTGDFQFNNDGGIFAPVIGVGRSKVTAQLANVQAKGSLIINGQGSFPHAPVPTKPASDVVSIFSDAYTNVPVRHYNGFFQGSNTTGGAGSDPNNVDIQAPFVNGDLDNIINYKMLDFVSIGMYEAVSNVDVSATTHFHVNINVRENVDNGDFIRIEFESGTGSGTTSGGTYTVNAAALRNADANGWVSVDVPLSSFSGFNNPSSLGQIFFVSSNTISDIWVDNVYFYKN
ncbi:carbohydrate-binding protein [Polaribacter porphyrae]|uniref:Carbohydrate-binding protein n=1 Tax=Polaribacter porphyrae TaxID=1137780 RepID=A0A2S7WN80_9FLAO|nr:carbohydrate-binding protein [Polaribacter porphyrae]PQJ78711.1 hypothetical protein BTO18_05705 [Polaribacter porphyrae]